MLAAARTTKRPRLPTNTVSDYTFSNALGYSQTQLAELHNLSFSGYFFPLTSTPESSADSWRIYSIDANRSIVMRDAASGAFVGLARVAVRGRRGWCAGFGIAPEYRGRGAAKVLAARMVAVARETGLASLQLEVLQQNIAARTVYERVGFTTRRQVVIVQAPLSALPADSEDEGAGAVRVEEVGLNEIAPSLLQSDPPTWQRELASILAIDVTVGVARGRRGESSALVVHRANGHAQIMAHATSDTTSDAALLSLLRWAGRGAGHLHLTNEPEQSPLLKRLRALGFAEIARQDEMVLPL